MWMSWTLYATHSHGECSPDTMSGVPHLGEAGHNTELDMADMLSARAWLAFLTVRLGRMTGLADDRTACPVRRAQRRGRPGQPQRTRCPVWSMMQQEWLHAHRQPRTACRSLMTGLAFGPEASARQTRSQHVPPPCSGILTPPAWADVSGTALCTSCRPFARPYSCCKFPATRRADG